MGEVKLGVPRDRTVVRDISTMGQHLAQKETKLEERTRDLRASLTEKAARLKETVTSLREMSQDAKKRSERLDMRIAEVYAIAWDVLSKERMPGSLEDDLKTTRGDMVDAEWRLRSLEQRQAAGEKVGDSLVKAKEKLDGLRTKESSMEGKIEVARKDAAAARLKKEKAGEEVGKIRESLAGLEGDIEAKRQEVRGLRAEILLLEQRVGEKVSDINSIDKTLTWIESQADERHKKIIQQTGQLRELAEK